MHNNVLALRWEGRKQREQDKEAKVSQARQRCRFLSLSQTPNTPRCSLLSLPPVAKQRGGWLSEK